MTQIKKPSSWFISTYCFKMFRKKHTLLSQLYWMSQLGNDSVAIVAKKSKQKAFITEELNSKVPRSMFPETCEGFLENQEVREGIARLHLLVICSANFEAYLQDSIRLYVGSLGYAEKNHTLSLVGNALARPVIRSSTVPDMIKYVEKLLELKFEVHLERWTLAYKLRCAAAHNGGIVTAKTKSDLPWLKLQVGSFITLDWSTLMSYLESADEIAATIDRTISNGFVRSLEAQWILEELKETKSLPPKSQVWQFLSHNYRISLSRLRTRKLEIEKMIYS